MILRGLLLTLFCFTLFLGVTGAQVTSHSFPEGRELAKKEGKLLLVYVHGSNWNRFSEGLFDAVWKQSLFQDWLAERGSVTADVDVLQAMPGNDKALALNKKRNRGWKAKWVRSYPSVVAFSSAGVLIGQLEGTKMPRNHGSAKESIRSFARECEMSVRLEREFLKAKEAGNKPLQIEILLSVDRLSLKRPDDLIARLKELDPKDALGHVMRLTFPSWHTVVNQATVEAKSGKAKVAKERLLGWLKMGVLTDEQKAVVFLALGNLCRYWSGHESEAAAPLKEAIRLAPDSVSGRAAKHLLEVMLAKP